MKYDEFVLLGATGITKTNLPVPRNIFPPQKVGKKKKKIFRKSDHKNKLRKKQVTGKLNFSVSSNALKKRCEAVSSTVEAPIKFKVPALDPARSLVASIKEAAQKYFGISELTQFQITAVKACIHKQDVIIIVPTGAGKSLCYQLPALIPESNMKFTLVISPLISLMEDQILALHARQAFEVKNVWTDIENCKFRIIYSSPEFYDLHKQDFERLKDKLILVAIDECHCISDWGHNFRPSYRRLKSVRESFPTTSLMCLTATATEAVCKDIERTFKFNLNTTIYLKKSVNRKNIYYHISYQDPKDVYSALKDLLKLEVEPCNNRPIVNNANVNPYSSTIIYVTTKASAENLASKLCIYGVCAVAYHAGLPIIKRSEIHRKFLSDEIQVVCATIAFGMGIDKPDIRQIIHWCLPSSLEAYMQQTGRAGRDRLPSKAYLFWAKSDQTATRKTLLSGSDEMCHTYQRHL